MLNRQDDRRRRRKRKRKEKQFPCHKQAVFFFVVVVVLFFDVCSRKTVLQYFPQSNEVSTLAIVYVNCAFLFHLFFFLCVCVSSQMFIRSHLRLIVASSNICQRTPRQKKKCHLCLASKRSGPQGISKVLFRFSLFKDADVRSELVQKKCMGEREKKAKDAPAFALLVLFETTALRCQCTDTHSHTQAHAVRVRSPLLLYVLPFT